MNVYPTGGPEPTPEGEWNASPTTPLSPDAERRAPEQPIAPPSRPARQAPNAPAYPPYPGYVPYPAAPQGYPAGPRERGRRSPWIVLAGGCLVLVAACVALSAAAGGVIWAVELTSVPVTSDTSKAFPVTGIPTLAVDVAAGDVHVDSGASAQVIVKVHRSVRAFTHDQAVQYLDAMRVNLTQDGNTVNVTVNQGNWDGFTPFLNRQLDVQVMVPSTTNLRTTMSAGDLQVNDITGAVNVHMSAGNANLENVTLAGTSTLDLTAGDVTFDGAMQKGVSLGVTLTAGDVNLSLPRNTDAHLDGHATAGDISVSGWTTNQSSSGGGTTVTADLVPNPTGTITIRVTAGDVNVTAKA
jgi:Putative adhesin